MNKRQRKKRDKKCPRWFLDSWATNRLLVDGKLIDGCFVIEDKLKITAEDIKNNK